MKITIKHKETIVVVDEGSSETKIRWADQIGHIERVIETASAQIIKMNEKTNEPTL